MALSLSCWLLSVATLFFCSIAPTDAEIFYVKPGDDMYCTYQPSCLALNEYVAQKEQYFLDNTTFMFLPGIHQLDVQLNVENLSNISFIGREEPLVQVSLSETVNITWINCDNIELSRLVFLVEGDQLEMISALYFHRTIGILSYLSFLGNGSNTFRAIFLNDSNEIMINNIHVSGATSDRGAALYGLRSVVNLYGNNSFTNNMAFGEGGAVALLGCNSNFFGNISFMNNTANDGGAVLIFGGTHNLFGNFSFEENLGTHSGGAVVLLSDSKVNIVGSISFINNSATNGIGGAVVILSGRQNISGKIDFANNRAFLGGGLWASEGSETFISGNISFIYNTANNGGAMSLVDSTTEIYGNISFQRNTAQSNGGVVSISNGSHSISGDISFVSNMAESGGAVSITGGNDHVVSGRISFVNNSATTDGGALYITGSSVCLSGNISFVGNSASDGGAVSMSKSKNNISGSILFVTNMAESDGGAISMSEGSTTLSGNITFIQNVAVRGGAVRMTGGSNSLTGNLMFIENRARALLSEGGGALFMSRGTHFFDGNMSFVGNSATANGGAIQDDGGNHTFIGNISFVSNTATFGFGGALGLAGGTNNITGNVLFLENNAKFGGGAMFIISDGHHSVSGNVSFIKNSADNDGGAIELSQGICTFSENVSFINNTSPMGGALAVYTISGDTFLNLTGSPRFEGNSARQGGAMAFFRGSKLMLSDPLQMTFVDNHAELTGGAIFFRDDIISNSQCLELVSINDREECFIELSSESNIHLNFSQNTAGEAGAVIYGGSLDVCKLYTGGGVKDNCGNIVNGIYSVDPPTIIRKISDINSDGSMTSDISSDPFQACICDGDDRLECDRYEVETVTGREFTLRAVVVGQNRGVVPSSVRISLDNNVRVDATQRVQGTGKQCTPITYRLFGRVNMTTVTLFPDDSICRGIGMSRIEIDVTFLPCPDGFVLVGSECICEERLMQFNVSCRVDDSSIERTTNSFWIGAVYDNDSYEGLILHSGGCPFDYCLDTPANITLDSLDGQCNYNHTGMLCGPCRDNHSIAFGTLHCLACSNAYLALLLPFAAMGAVLVAMLLLLNLTVTVGTIHGLIFYANVVQAAHSTFFPSGETNILTVFIAWLNLDLGIESCFYDGMNAYAFTWLQFLFPFYVWFLIGLLIVVSRFSGKISRSLGNNPVATLATLFLLSYSKILRNIIAVLSVSSLQYPDRSNKLVWLYDGSVPYFQRADHILLGIFTLLLLVFLFLPYTLLLLCGHWFQAYSNWKIFSWANKLKPFMDAYHAPYKRETRYWPGLVLLVRCAMFAAFTLTSLDNSHFELLLITSLTVGLSALAWAHHGVYESFRSDLLEASFILNLCILAAATYHVQQTGGSQAALAYTSVSITFVMFIFIVLYHLYLAVRKMSMWKKFIQSQSPKKYQVLISHGKADELEDGKTGADKNKTVTGPLKIPTTVVELRESLLTPTEK